MSEYEDDTDSDASDEIDGLLRDSFASLLKVKSNTPRARFDVHFCPTSIQLLQFSVQKRVSNHYCICKDNVSEMFRLPYSNGKQNFFVLHLKSPIVGGNKSFTNYDFVVFNIAEDDYEEISLDLTNPIVRDMFDEDTVESGCISDNTIEIFETILVKIFDKDVTTPAKNYDGNRSALALPCTLWDNNEHFLYPLDNGFVNVWKYCQLLSWREVKSVRFVCRKGRLKTFDFYVYPKLERAIRRYDIGAGQSNMINCFFLEFKAIDQEHYDGLFAYCVKNKITISTKDYRNSASDTDSDNVDESSESQTPTETNASESDDGDEQLVVDYEAPDPYMAKCDTEGRRSESEVNSSEEESDITATSEEKEPKETASSQESEIESKKQPRSRKRIIVPESDSSSSESVKIRPKRRSLRIDSSD